MPIDSSMTNTLAQDRALQAILERARRSKAKNQHLVPRFYLNQWADERGLVRVTDKEVGVDYLKKPAKVARITDFYTLENDKLDPSVVPPLLAETLFAEVESQTAPIIRRLSSEGEVRLTPTEVVSITLFLALQLNGTGPRRFHRPDVQCGVSECSHASYN